MKKKDDGKSSSGRLVRLLDDVPGEGFSELNPTVLALEETDQHVLLGLATL